MEVSPRLARWVTREFSHGSAQRALASLRDLPTEVIGGQHPERIQAALVVRTGGEWPEFERMLGLAGQDWRDLLVAAELADDTWPAVLEDLLGASGVPD